MSDSSRLIFYIELAALLLAVGLIGSCVYLGRQIHRNFGRLHRFPVVAD
jgi:hypothetical protein